MKLHRRLLIELYEQYLTSPISAKAYRDIITYPSQLAGKIELHTERIKKIINFIQQREDKKVEHRFSYLPDTDDAQNHRKLLLPPIRTAIKIAQRQKRVLLLTGRDMLPASFLMRQMNYDHDYFPEINRNTAYIARLPKKRYMFLDTGFAGSVYKRLVYQRVLDITTTMFLLSHEQEAHTKNWKIGTLTREQVLNIENTVPKPMTSYCEAPSIPEELEQIIKMIRYVKQLLKE